MAKNKQVLEVVEGSVHVEVNMSVMLLFRFLMLNTWMTRNGKIKWIITALTVPLLAMYLVDSAYNTTTLLLALILVLNLVVQPLALYLSAKKQMKVNKNYQKLMKLSFTKEGIFVQQHTGKSITNWFMFISVFESMKLILFYTARDQAIILPKALLTEDEISKIRSQVLNHREEIKKCKIKKA